MSKLVLGFILVKSTCCYLTIAYGLTLEAVSTSRPTHSDV